MFHYIPKAKLPSAKEMVEVVLSNFFSLHKLFDMWFRTGGLNSCSSFGRYFPRCWELLTATVSHLVIIQSPSVKQNGSTHDLEISLHCLASRNPTYWSNCSGSNTLPCCYTTLSPFQCTYGYQPPLFQALEREVGFSSMVALVQC